MLDCFGYKRGQIIAYLNTEWGPFLDDNLVALFNLRVESDIEMDALPLGVRGFFYEKDRIRTLKKGITSIFNHEIWVSRQKLAECFCRGGNVLMSFAGHKGPARVGLTKRERQIIAMIATGASNADIANTLFISTHTVRTHNYNIFKKIKVTNRIEAALWSAKYL